jgi:two-component system, NarL family, response regulator LiaR
MRKRLIKVLIVDDHAMVRKGMKALMAEFDDIVVVGEAPEGQKAVELVQILKPDVVLLDLLMPVMDGIETTKQILAIQPDQRIIILTAYMGDDKITMAMNAGAIGYLVKEALSEDLIQSIRNVSPREPLLNATIAWKDLNVLYTAKETEGSAQELLESDYEVLCYS